MGNANTLAFKLENPSPKLRTRLDNDRRVGSVDMQKSRWFTLELSSGSDLHDAIDWLGLAFDGAGKVRKTK